MGRLLEALGVPRERLTLESRSRDTYENAVFTKRLINPAPGERWLLVTSGWHMPRAIGCFRKAGFPVEAWTVDYRTSGRVDLWPNSHHHGRPAPDRFCDAGIRRAPHVLSEQPHQRPVPGPVSL